MNSPNESPLEAGLRAVREMPDDLSVEEHLRSELQSAHDRIVCLVAAIRALNDAARRVLEAKDSDDKNSAEIGLAKLVRV